ncbi:MAG: hypothetical protein B7Y45_11845 [Sphingomonas sp. 28-66-16]|nr:MAG: hypothetical protein B7Y45_11845 [Sphingomonas sp. 28-66-16]
MVWLFATGHAVDLVLLVMLVEAVWLRARHRWRVGAIARCFLPGVFMLLALRAALTGLDWRWIAGALALSFPVHLADIARRGR